MSTTMVAFAAFLAVAGAALMGILLNIGAPRAHGASALDSAPQVVSPAGALAAGLLVAVPSAAALWFLSPILSLLGFILGAEVALGVRSYRFGKWHAAITRDVQVLVQLLVLQLDTGGDSLYRALEQAALEGRMTVLGPLVEEHVLAAKASGELLSDALETFARCRLIAYAPIVHDVFVKLADLAARDVPTTQQIEVLRNVDAVMTRIVKLEREQRAASAQNRYSTYIVLVLVLCMAGVVLFMARDLGEMLLHTLPGNITLLGVTVLMAVALYAAEQAAYSRPLRF